MDQPLPVSMNQSCWNGRTGWLLVMILECEVWICWPECCHFWMCCNFLSSLPVRLDMLWSFSFHLKVSLYNIKHTNTWIALILECQFVSVAFLNVGSDFQLVWCCFVDPAEFDFVFFWMFPCIAEQANVWIVWSAYVGLNICFVWIMSELFGLTKIIWTGKIDFQCSEEPAYLLP
jgi:hypothetical protein